jgi:hypothetical protein
VENSPFDKAYFGETTLSPVGLAAVIVLGLAILLLPRRRAVWPMLIMACFVPPAQRVVIFALNFDLLRVLLLFATLRVLARAEWRGLQWKWMDTVWMVFCCYGVMTLILLYNDGDIIKNQLGFLYDTLGMYFLFRCLIRRWEDVDEVARAAIFISIPVAIAFLIEHATRHNIFAFMGGVPAITGIRDGRLRCQGAFAHPILAGCFWVALMPLMALGWWRGGRERMWAVIGLGAASVIVIMCASSTPVMALLFSLLAVALFPLRRRMRWIRWGLLGTIVGLHLCMKAPVWHLLSRLDVVGGSTGWHRYHLIDECINHANEWWLIGSNLGTAHWGQQLFDVTNLYVVQCLHGGIGLLLLFILVIATGFQGVGRMLRAAGKDPERLRRAWALGICLFAHTMNFIAVSYFGQINMVWYMLLAMIASLAPARTALAVAATPRRRKRVQLQRSAHRPRGSLVPPTLAQSN